MTTRSALESELDSFDPARRAAALAELAGGASLPGAGANVNMHFHSFFSYNANGWSPSRIAWEARRRGLYAAGLCDFDVLDGLEEFLAAGRTLGLRAAVNLETRAYMPEYADVDISSPGEPGVTYIMGAGFAREPAAGTRRGEGLAGYRRRAQERNLALIARVNAGLPEIAVDCEADVLPLTPQGVATERHIVSAYIARAARAFAAPGALPAFWARVLGTDAARAQALLADRPALEEKVRGRLAKRGGLGYEQPSPGTFPPAAEFIRWVRACRAIPMVTWLDGTSGGEADPEALLDVLCGQGAAALNLIPDRNWNVADPDERARKVANLRAITAAAARRDLPVNIGTEMNKLGLPFVDDLAGEALRPHRAQFLAGARVMVGQSVLARYAGLSYVDARADEELGGARGRNAFFGAVGGLPPLDADAAARLEDMGEERALAWLRERAARAAA